MRRYRLRFLVQEIELTGPEVVIGRSPDCQIAIEDPLVSRRHARILLSERGAALEDLGSRNGLALNGEAVRGAMALADGDRIRIGTQELVFGVADRPNKSARTTGYMRVCEGCEVPYPAEASQCPHCGAVVTSEEITIANLPVDSRKAWTLELMLDVFERALVLGRMEESVRLQQKCDNELRRIADAQAPLKPDQLTRVAAAALGLAALSQEPRYLGWMLQVFREHRSEVDVAAVGQLIELRMPESQVRALEGMIDGVRRSQAWRAGDEVTLERLCRALRG